MIFPIINSAAGNPFFMCDKRKSQLVLMSEKKWIEGASKATPLEWMQFFVTLPIFHLFKYETSAKTQSPEKSSIFLRIQFPVANVLSHIGGYILGRLSFNLQA